MVEIARKNPMTDAEVIQSEFTLFLMELVRSLPSPKEMTIEESLVRDFIEVLIDLLVKVPRRTSPNEKGFHHNFKEVNTFLRIMFSRLRSIQPPDPQELSETKRAQLIQERYQATVMLLLLDFVLQGQDLLDRLE